MSSLPLIKIAPTWALRPSGQPIRNITDVTMRRNSIFELTIRSDAPGIVHPQTRIAGGNALVALLLSLVDNSFQPVTIGSTRHPVLHHLLDLRFRAGVSVSTGTLAIV